MSNNQPNDGCCAAMPGCAPSELSGVDTLDLAHLNRAGPVLRERALVGVLALFESEQGAYADAQTAAIGERIETDPMRRLNLELLGR